MTIIEKKFDINCYKCEGTGCYVKGDGFDDIEVVECDCYLPVSEQVTDDFYGDYSDSEF